jgi:hypothetical protein
VKGLLLLLPVAAFAQTETQHAFEAVVPLRSGLELTIHSRFRTQPGGLGFYQGRLGPILSWDATGRLALTSGYYYASQERRTDSNFITGHRLFGGAEMILYDARRWSIDQRALVERFLSSANEDYNRYRLRTRLSAKGTLEPYTSHELFFDAQGWRSNRHGGGVRVKATPSLELEAGYLYERRRMDVGSHRHLWLTSIRWTLPVKR